MSSLQTDSRLSVWIGFFGMVVESENQVLPNCKYAYVTAVGYGKTRDDFIEKVRESCAQLGFIVAEFEDVELLSSRAKTNALNEVISALAETAIQSKSIEYTTFHGSTDEDEPLH